MKVSRDELREAAEGLLSTEQVDRLWESLAVRQVGRPRFDLPHLAYYLGALIVISAMGWFVSDGWERFSGGALLAIALTYALAFALAGRSLWRRPGLRVPGGLLFTIAVCMTPLAVYGFERMTGLWPQDDPGTYRDYFAWVKGGWFGMETATIAVGLLALRYVRFPFLVAPVALSLWFMSMDLTPLLFGGQEVSWQERELVSLWFGLAVLLVAYGVDRRTRGDYAFWLYLFGMLAFWGGLSLMDSDSELDKFLYGLTNLGLILLSILLQRRVFVVFGTLGLLGYIGHLAYEVFQDSLLFPFALSLVGIATIYLGLLYQRHSARWEQALAARIPAAVRRLLPTGRRPPGGGDHPPPAGPP